VTANAGSIYNAMCIGNGSGGTASNDAKVKIMSNAVVFVTGTNNDKIGGTNVTNELTGGLLFDDATSGRFLGSQGVTLKADLTIPSGKILKISDSGKTLTIPNGRTLTNNGTIIVNNIPNGIVNSGTIENKSELNITGNGNINNSGTGEINDSGTIIGEDKINGNRPVHKGSEKGDGGGGGCSAGFGGVSLLLLAGLSAIRRKLS
jgi:hypothetical protein